MAVSFDEAPSQRVGIPLESAALGGVAFALYKRQRADFLILSLFGFFFLMMQSVGFGYHLLPGIPFCSFSRLDSWMPSSVDFNRGRLGPRALSCGGSFGSDLKCLR